MKHVVNALGLACPLPLVNTKEEIKSMKENEIVEVLVDNEIAVQNLTKFSNVRGYDVRSEKINNDEYHVYITVKEIKKEEEEIVCMPNVKENTVVVIGSNEMGNGAEKLGKSLLKAFIFALTKQDKLPDTMLFYNSGAYMTIEGSDALEDLKTLEANGVEIFTCGTCLNFYEITDKLAIGNVTNMYDIVEKMNNATKILKP